MRILILGGDGYLGWPTSMALSSKGHEVFTVDNFLRRKIMQETDSEPLFSTPKLTERAQLFKALSGYNIEVSIGDCTDYPFLLELIRKIQPDTIIHYAEQPSAPYSMRDQHCAQLTFQNNMNATFNVIWAIMQAAPACHLIKLGTMGEYGTPNIDIEEGWIDIEHKGRKDRFLFPRQAGSLYHTTKVMDTDLIWFYVRTFGLQATDLMQGPVYGIETAQTVLDEKLLPYFNYDDIFGTVVNRFLTQAVAGIPLTIYGKGNQVRGYLNIIDTLQCVELALLNPPGKNKLRVLNQFTETFSVNDLAKKIQLVGNQIGLNVSLNSIDNPRKEAEDHYYNPAHTGLIDIGLKPHYLTDDVVAKMLEKVMQYKSKIEPHKVHPRVRWAPQK